MLNGRYGPYVTDGKKNAKIPKDRDPKSLTLEECTRADRAGAGARHRPFGRGKRPAAKGAAAAAPAGAAAGNGAAAKGKTGARKKAAATPAATITTVKAAAPPAATRAPKVSRGAAPPKPKGVAHIVRKGRSAAAKAHARKKAVRPERTAVASGKSAPKRARGAKA